MENNYPTFIPWPNLPKDSQHTDSPALMHGLLLIGENYDEVLQVVRYPEVNEFEIRPYWSEKTPYRLSIFFKLPSNLVYHRLSVINLKVTIWDWSQQEHTLSRIIYDIKSSCISWCRNIIDSYLVEYVNKVMQSLPLLFQPMKAPTLSGNKCISYAKLYRTLTSDKISCSLEEDTLKRIWFVHDAENLKYFVIAHLEELINLDGEPVGYKAQIYQYENLIFPQGLVMWEKGGSLGLWPEGYYPGIHEAVQGEELPEFLKNLILL